WREFMSEQPYTQSLMERPESAQQPSQVRPPAPWRVTFSWLVGRALPNFLVLFALGGLAYWGHQTGWKLPRFAELTGQVGEGKDDWCAAHAVSESGCVECNPKLLPRGKPYGWCKVHGVHECPLEHPDVAQVKYPPRVTQADLARARRSLDF